MGPSGINISHYTWALSQRSLKSLRLWITNWSDLQNGQSSINDIAQQLQQLRDLALVDVNQQSSRITWGQLAPLAGCTLLTRLELEHFTMNEPAEIDDQNDDAAAALPGAQPAPHAQNAGGVQRALCLPSLRKLCISSMGSAVWKFPLMRFAPNLTGLEHVSEHS
jgi:hypothetical protein